MQSAGTFGCTRQVFTTGNTEKIKIQGNRQGAKSTKENLRKIFLALLAVAFGFDFPRAPRGKFFSCYGNSASGMRIHTDQVRLAR